jgi:hypothetical protein
VTRLWRGGNRGNVASVLIEKPARGDFLPILDGGYSLQYSPLLEYREGRGVVVFCQLDVTGRTESDPVAESFVANLLNTVSRWKPAPVRRAVYAGEAAGRAHLEAAGVVIEAERAGAPAVGTVLVLGPGAAREGTVGRAEIAAVLAGGGRVVALGLESEELGALLPFKVEVAAGEHIATFFEPLSAGTALAGLGPADVHNRDPRKLPLITAAARVVGNGVLAVAEKEAAVFCQLLPWRFDPKGTPNLKRTFRRVAFATTRLLANQGVELRTPLLERFSRPCDAKPPEKRWLSGLYLDEPEEWDDPYRFFRW